MDIAEIIQRILITLPLFIFSLSVHEAAHAMTALYCGDPTARDLGRITLNPVSHIDILGTIIIPMLGTLLGGVAFLGWAKPVPVDRRNFYHMRRDDILVSVAGPASNIVLSILFLLALILFLFTPLALVETPVSDLFHKVLRYGIIINIGLALFNMIPIPPLDGSHVLANVLPPHLEERYRRITPYGGIILIILINIPLFSRLISGMIGLFLIPYQGFMSLFGMNLF